MAKTTTSSNDYLALVYNATAIANIADNAASSPLANIFIAGHTADPGVGGTQTTNEANYTGYARASVARTSGGFTVATQTLTLVANASLGACSAGSNTLTHWSTGVAVSGSTKILHRGVFGSRLGPFTGATSDTITLPGTTLAVDDRVVFYSVLGSTLPTGVTEGTVYFVKTASGADITIAATSGGTTIDITVAGDGLAFRVTPIAVSAGVTPQLSLGAIIFEE